MIDRGKRRGMLSSRPPFMRMQWLDEQMRNGRYPTVAEAVKRFEVSRRTILRDVEYMCLMLSAPIGYDRRRQGYYYTNSTFTPFRRATQRRRTAFDPRRRRGPQAVSRHAL